jgi:hypothetical protein
MIGPELQTSCKCNIGKASLHIPYRVDMAGLGTESGRRGSTSVLVALVSTASPSVYMISVVST